MRKLSTNLKTLMAELHLTESELARRTNVGQPVVHRIASGETDNPKVGTLSPIAKFFGISISQLVGDLPMPAGRLAGTFNPLVTSWKSIPLLSWEQAGTWPNLAANPQPIKSISTDLPISDKSFALMLKDTTMEPRFPEGTTIILDPALTPEDRDYVVAMVDGFKLPTFKQLLIDGKNNYLKAINPDFKTVPLDKGFRFLGVMVQARLDYIKLNEPTE